MPTTKKAQDVTTLEKRIAESTIAIATDYSGMSVTDMTDLRRALRGQGVDFRVVKNTLTYIAADTAGKPQIKEIVQGPTGMAFGYGEVVDPAKALTDFIRDRRSALKVRGAVMGDRTLTPDEVEALGKLPPKDVLIARLAGQLQGGIAGLLYVLSAPITGLAIVLKRHTEALEAGAAAEAPAAEPEAAVAEEEAEVAATEAAAETVADAEATPETEATVDDEAEATVEPEAPAEPEAGTEDEPEAEAEAKPEKTDES